MLRKTTATHTVALHNGGLAGNTLNVVSFRTIKNGKGSGKTFTKGFASDADALAYYNAK